MKVLAALLVLLIGSAASCQAQTTPAIIAGTLEAYEQVSTTGVAGSRRKPNSATRRTRRNGHNDADTLSRIERHAVFTVPYW
jgi:hypothetical protein